MRCILDTHTLLWIVNDDERLSKQAKRVYLDNSNQLFFSTASVWEMAIKISLNKLSTELSLAKFVEKHVHGNDINMLNVAPVHIFPLVNLPFHHRDPFDRLIISQCIQEKMTLISKDRTFDKYNVKRIW